MNFEHANTLLHLFWVLPLLLAAAAFGGWRRRRLARLVADPGRRAALTANVSPRARRWRLALLLAAVGALFVALARPRWGTELVPQTSVGRDLLVLVDVSRSMLARDVRPGTRLDHAKFLIRELIARTPGDRYGLIPFAGEAFLQCPLTPSRASLTLFLDDLNTNTVSVGGTNIQRALEVALDAFAAAEGGHRGIILISDGEQLDGNMTAPLAALREAGIPIFVAGIGDPAVGSLIQLPDGDFVRGPDGERVRTRLDEAGLRELARTTGGVYVRSTAVDDGLETLVRHILALVPEEAETAGTRTRPIERYVWPLLLAVLLLLARLSLGERRRVAAAAMLLLLTAVASAQLAPPEGPAATADDAARERVETLRERLAGKLEGPERALLHYNLGVNLQRLGEAAEAEREYQRALDLSGELPELRAAAHRNLGVLRHREALAALESNPDTAIRQLDQASRFYREAMRLDTADGEGAGRNQELALTHRRLAEEIRQLMQQLQQQRQDAREQAEKARDEQQQANRQPGDPEQQEAAARETEQAAELAEALAEQARRHGRDAEAQPAQQAAEHLRNARRAQEQARGEPDRDRRLAAGQQAEQEIAKAIEQLGGQQEPQTDGENGEDGERQPGDDDPQFAEDTRPRDGQPQPGAETEAELDLDREHAMRVLRAMQDREAALREDMQKREAARRVPVTRDW